MRVNLWLLTISSGGDIVLFSTVIILKKKIKSSRKKFYGQKKNTPYVWSDWEQLMSFWRDDFDDERDTEITCRWRQLPSSLTRCELRYLTSSWGQNLNEMSRKNLIWLFEAKLLSSFLCRYMRLCWRWIDLLYVE